MKSGFGRRRILSGGRKWVLAMALAVGASVSGGVGARAQTIALVQINQQALFFNQMNEGATRAAKEAGANLVIFNANNDPAAQNNAIETYIQQKVKALLVVAIDVNGVKPAIKAAKEAGIPVVAIDAIISDGDNAVQVGVDNKAAGADIGRVTGEYVNSKLGGSADVGIVGALNSYIQNVRLDGFKEGLGAGGAKAKIVDTVDGRNIQDVALSAAENLITANPNMKVVYATGEPALVGALSAVTAQNAGSRVKIFGWDLTAQVIKAIDDGIVAAVIQQDPAAMGVAGVQAALKLIKGETVPKQVDVPVTIVTTANVDKYRSMFK